MTLDGSVVSNSQWEEEPRWKWSFFIAAHLASLENYCSAYLTLMYVKRILGIDSKRPSTDTFVCLPCLVCSRLLAWTAVTLTSTLTSLLAGVDTDFVGFGSPISFVWIQCRCHPNPESDSTDNFLVPIPILKLCETTKHFKNPTTRPCFPSCLV